MSRDYLPGSFYYSIMNFGYVTVNGVDSNDCYSFEYYK